MQHFLRRFFVKPGWGPSASILLHLMLAALVFYRLPAISKPEPDHSVNVELVEMPEKAAPAPRLEHAQKAAPQAFESASDKKTETEPEPTQSQHPPVETLEDKPAETDNSLTPPSTPAKDNDDAGVDTQKPTDILSTRSQQDTASVQDNPQRPNTAPEVAKPLPKQSPKSLPKPGKLTPVKQIYAKDALADPRIRQALGKLPKRDRILQICGIEALEQVRHQRPNTFPDMLAPSGGTVSGNSVSVRDGAFRSRALWYAIDFDCQLDDKAMQITQFSYAIGAQIPRAQWNARELPVQ